MASSVPTYLGRLQTDAMALKGTTWEQLQALPEADPQLCRTITNEQTRWSHGFPEVRRKETRPKDVFFPRKDAASVQTVLAEKYAGYIPVQRDPGTGKTFALCSPRNLLLRKARPRAARIKNGDISLYFDTEHGMYVKYHADLDGEHLVELAAGSPPRPKKNRRAQAAWDAAHNEAIDRAWAKFRALVTSIVPSMQKALAKVGCAHAVLAVHVGTGWKPSAHVIALANAWAADIDEWKRFAKDMLAPTLTPEEGPPFFDDIYRVGAFRMNGCCKLGALDRALSEAPDPELSHPHAVDLFNANRVAYELASIPCLIMEREMGEQLDTSKLPAAAAAPTRRGPPKRTYTQAFCNITDPRARAVVRFFQERYKGQRMTSKVTGQMLNIQCSPSLFCPFVGRTHARNTTYINANLRTGKYHFQCMDPDCRDLSPQHGEWGRGGKLPQNVLYTQSCA